MFKTNVVKNMTSLGPVSLWTSINDIFQANAINQKPFPVPFKIYH